MQKIFGLLGLSMKAGKLVSGEFSVEKAVKERKAFLVIVAYDASDLTKKRFHDKCSFYHVPITEFGTKETLGRAIGKEERASIACTDRQLADTLRKKIEQVV